MNWLYPKDDARAFLNAQVQAASQEEDPLWTPLTNLQLTRCSVAPYRNPPCLRLIQESNGEKEEVTVRVLGIICKKTLPPVCGPLVHRRGKGPKPTMLRQYVRLTGLGSPAFEDYRAIMEEVYALFTHKAGLGAIDSPSNAVYEGEFAVDMHTRYLTERRLVEYDKHIPFPSNVDPNNALEDVRGGNLIRTVDNVVQYVRKTTSPGQRAKYAAVAPSEFKEGDVVEAAVSFMAYPLPSQGDEPRYKMVLALRALCLLSTEFRDRSKPIRKVFEETEKAGPSRSSPIPSSGSLKRKFVSYSDLTDEDAMDEACASDLPE